MNSSFLSFGQLDISILIAIITTILAINVLKPFALSINLTDLPDNRKHHKGSIPLIGGLSMFFGFLVSIILTDGDLSTNKYFLLAALILVTVGALDDHHDISVISRFFFQISAAVIVVIVAGVDIESIGTIVPFRGEILLNSWSIFFSITCVIVGINALNMSDGIHGLAGSTSLMTFLSLAFFAYIDGNKESLIIAILMCAVIPPFLFYNLRSSTLSKKQIFMGDAGSMFLGLGIVWLLVSLSQGDTSSFSPVIGLWLFGVPLIDGVATVLQRAVKGQSPFKPDMNHLHHVLISIGFSKKNTLIIILLFSFFMILIGIFGELNKIDEWQMFFVFVIVFVVFYIFKNLLISKNNINIL